LLLLLDMKRTCLFIAQVNEHSVSINRIPEIKYWTYPVDPLRRTRNDPAVDELTKSVAEGFGARLRTARENAGLTQEELAYLAGTNRSAVSPLELGQHIPRMDTLIRLAGALGVEPCELMGDVRWLPPPGDARSPGRFSDPAESR